MHKSLIAVLLPSLLILLIIADGYFYSAHAQCAPTDKIYIDPRLVPMRRPITLDEYASTMNNHALPESWSRKSEQGDKWSFCLTAGTLCPANQEKP
jgi:hypothetical protein